MMKKYLINNKKQIGFKSGVDVSEPNRSSTRNLEDRVDANLC